MIGRRLAHYTILAPLGEGGMGVVYKAHDDHLDRHVALKLLPPDLVADPERRRRFAQEARAASALNHPGIITIYDIAQADGVDFIAMELVSGRTLAELIGRDGLRVKDLVSYALQIASALSKAHASGIVHRDLKPSNIMVTGDGHVKVLDFGVAKLQAPGESDAVGSTAATAAATRTAATVVGTVVGTLAYMSPEQAQGLPVDARSDIFSFGTVLYEMATGRRAFDRPTPALTMSAVVSEEPPRPGELKLLPRELERLILKCQRKDPARRFQVMADVAVELEDIRTDSTGGAEAVAVPVGTSRTVRRWQRAAAFATILAAGLGAWSVMTWVRSGGAQAASSTAQTKAAQLTNYGDYESSGAISPDGRSFAFVSDHAGTADIWIRQVIGGEPVRLTNDVTVEIDLTFSPDGERLYFTRPDGPVESIWQIGALGGQPRKVIDGARGAALSSDGRLIAYLQPGTATGDSLYVRGVDGGEARLLARNIPGFPRTRPAWSPDNRSVSFTRTGLFAPWNLFVVDVASGTERQATRFDRASEGVGQHAWLPDGRHLVVSYSAYSRTQPRFDLGILDVTDGSVARLSLAIGDSFVTPSLSADGRRLIATTQLPLLEVWHIPVAGADPDANGRAAVRLLDDATDPLWTFASRDGKTLLFSSTSTGSRNLWLKSLDDNARPRQITEIAGDAVAHSSLSPDGRQVAFLSFAAGASDIWLQNVDGSGLRPLTTDPEPNAWPVWSPDARSIVFNATASGRQETRILSLETGRMEKLIDGFFRGDWIRNPAGGSWIVTSDGLTNVRLIDVERRAVIWNKQLDGSSTAMPVFRADGRAISVLVQSGRNQGTLLVLDTATGEARTQARFPFPTIFRAAWVDNNRAVIVNRQESRSHIVLFDQFWQPAP